MECPEKVPSSATSKASKRIQVDSYSCLAQQLWLYSVPLLARGWKAPLEEDNCLELPSHLLMASNADAAEEVWQAERKRGSSTRSTSLARAFVCKTCPALFRGCTVAFVNGLINALIRPYILRECIALLTQPMEGTLSRSGMLLGLLILASIVEAWTSCAVMAICAEEVGTSAIAFTSRLLCRKSITIAPCDEAKQVSTLFGNDVMRTYEAARPVGYLPLGAAAVIGGVCMLLLTVGVAAFAGILCMLVILFLTQKMASLTAAQGKRCLEASGKRLAVLEQIVESSKAVKLFSWEEQYLKVLGETRETELSHIKKQRWYLVASIQMGRLSPIISSACTVVFMVLLGMDLTAADIFATIAVFMALRLALIILPQGAASLGLVLVSFRRIQNYLELPDSTPRATLLADSPDAVEAVDVGLAWPGQETSIVTGTMRVPRGKSLAVVGPVGCGKSTLLSAIVGELPPKTGSVRTAALLAYAPQQPQVICGTVLDNILLGRDFDRAAFDQAVEAADLQHDLELLPGGLEAEIGERGVSLSGGQKQRISLARTVYGLADDALLVLDDPIAAVDPMVGRNIIERIVLAHKARGGTVVVALNQEAYLHHFDMLISVRSGTMVQQDPPQPPWRSASRRAEQTQSGAGARENKSVASSRKSSVILEEIRVKGAMKGTVLLTFLRSMGWHVLGLYLFVAASGYAFMASADIWLANWTRTQDLDHSEHMERLGIYLGLVVAFSVAMLCGSRLAVLGTTWASRLIHHQCTRAMLHAPLSWWDGTPKGRITSRFSTDLGQVDLMLGFMFDNSVQLAFNILALCAIVALVIPVMLVLILLCFIIFGLMFIIVNQSNSEVKRMAHHAMAPLLSNIGECIQMQRAATLIKGAEEFLVSRNDRLTDAYSRMNYTSGILMHFLKLTASIAAAGISAGTVAWLIFFDRSNPEQGTVAMTYSITIPYFMGMCCQTFTWVRLQLTGLERLLEYTELPQEPEWRRSDDPSPAAWPKQGELEFQGVCMRYQPNLPFALDDVSFSVPGGARVGIVGRTGSGKSSLVACLFRLHEAQKGKVLLDTVNVADLGLRCLRRCITVVPQDPVLMAGTVQKNLDPFGAVSKKQLLQAVQRAELATSDEDADTVLLRNLDRGGSNLSCGERQLLCLARAAINGPTVLVMDEPTSSADPETDAKLQKMVRACFLCTTLCVAHRIQTIMDSDLILVMRDGKVREFGAPASLFEHPEGEFRKMCELSDIKKDTSGTLSQCAGPSKVSFGIPSALVGCSSCLPLGAAPMAARLAEA
mmetsp:Transcript_80974/g.203787  ORF Transcript_80974/g.203787 Transcript_80974/m.203787 type:complete len:1280 (-) Transcript_80974:292-4131(-)